MIGWILLSRRAVACAAEALEDNGRGVRDEVGFISLHQAISDRLFPGTSVLHTRARYALLVPWLMRRVATGGDRDAERRLLKAEGELAAQLVRGQDAGLDAEGAIGALVWRKARRPPAQPPSFSYWSALNTWGIVQPRPAGGTPSRAEVLRRLTRATQARPRGDDDPGPDDEATSPFIAMPEPPIAFGDNSQALDLVLTEDERVFLRRQLIGVLRGDGTQSFLARLAEVGLKGTAATPWSQSVMRHADEADRKILLLAERTAALAAIGRAVYAALAEAAWTEDGHATSDCHAATLASTCVTYGDTALQLDVGALSASFPKLPTDLLQVLVKTQTWLRDGRSELKGLRPLYAKAEEARKGDRARLPLTLGARQRRSEWDPLKHPPATPLSYRWSNVTRLVRDLRT